ncbi:hypothetical protein BKA93DRAFT_450602 [Sparassis latifolia]
MTLLNTPRLDTLRRESKHFTNGERRSDPHLERSHGRGNRGERPCPAMRVNRKRTRNRRLTASSCPSLPHSLAFGPRVPLVLDHIPTRVMMLVRRNVKCLWHGALERTCITSTRLKMIGPDYTTQAHSSSPQHPILSVIDSHVCVRRCCSFSSSRHRIPLHFSTWGYVDRNERTPSTSSGVANVG